MRDDVCRGGADGVPTFVEAGAPTADEPHARLQMVITRLMKMLTRRSVLIEEMGQTYLADPGADGDEARTLRPLQAAVRVEVYDRKRMGQLCRYITRPALSDESAAKRRRAELKLKTPWRNGTTHLVMSPLEFIQRLAAPRWRPGRTRQSLHFGGECWQLDARSGSIAGPHEWRLTGTQNHAI